MYYIFFIHSSVDGHLGCFHVLAIVNSAAVNCIFSNYVFSGYMPSSGIAGSYGSSIFSFLRNLHTVLHSGELIVSIYSTTNSVRWFPFLHTLQHLLFVVFLMMARNSSCLGNLKGYPVWLNWWGASVGLPLLFHGPAYRKLLYRIGLFETLKG